MAVLKRYNLSGEAAGELEIDDSLLNLNENTQMIKDYLIALRANLRQWSACTKGRSEVNHSTKKPHPQKGTGRARQGSLAAPQFRGGRVFGPKPKFDQKVRINKKERRLAISALLSEKIQAGNLIVLNYSDIQEPKTALVAKFLNALGISGKRVLFLAESAFSETSDKYMNLVKSSRNIPEIWFKSLFKVNGYDVAVNHDIVLVDSAIDDLKALLGGE